jgi:putative ABC transport system permease protein
MLKNYLTIAWRNLLRNKAFSIINISGLAIGLSCFLLIAMYVLDELSFDRYNIKADRIYRINADAHWGGQDLHLAETPDVVLQQPGDAQQRLALLPDGRGQIASHPQRFDGRSLRRSQQGGVPARRRPRPSRAARRAIVSGKACTIRFR